MKTNRIGRAALLFSAAFVAAAGAACSDIAAPLHAEDLPMTNNPGGSSGVPSNASRASSSCQPWTRPFVIA